MLVQVVSSYSSMNFLKEVVALYLSMIKEFLKCYYFDYINGIRWFKGVLYVTDTVCSNNQAAEGEKLLDAEGHISLLCSVPGSKNIQSDSGASLAASGETQCDEEKEKCTQSTSYYDNKSAFFSAVCLEECHFSAAFLIYCLFEVFA